MVFPAEGRPADRNPYVGYDTDDSPFLYDGYIDDRLETTERVVGYRHRLADGTVLEFAADGTTIKDTATGSTWNLFGVATEGELAGTQLRQIISVTHFWFAWQAFHSNTIIWEPDTTTDALLMEDE